jgi:hypothetical protein
MDTLTWIEINKDPSTDQETLNEERTIPTVLSSYRSELDGLKTIAVLAVIFFHAGFGFCKGGFVGVDIFFVLSGYLMTSLIVREMQKGQFTTVKFYEGRIRGILPMLYMQPSQFVTIRHTHASPIQNYCSTKRVPFSPQLACLISCSPKRQKATLILKLTLFLWFIL